MDPDENHTEYDEAGLDWEAVMSWECKKCNDVHSEEGKRAVWIQRLTLRCRSCFLHRGLTPHSLSGQTHSLRDALFYFSHFSLSTAFHLAVLFCQTDLFYWLGSTELQGIWLGSCWFYKMYNKIETIPWAASLLVIPTSLAILSSIASVTLYRYTSAIHHMFCVCPAHPRINPSMYHRRTKNAYEGYFNDGFQI